MHQVPSHNERNTVEENYGDKIKLRNVPTYVSRAFVGQLNKEKSGEEGANAVLFK